MTALPDRLAARTLELVDIGSESGNEEAIREHLLGLVPPSYERTFTGDEVDLFLPGGRSGSPLVVLAGHYDTVPAQDNLPGRIADGSVHGLGASDMKGGLAVALELIRDLAVREMRYDVGLLLFGREELPPEFDPLPALLRESSAIHEAALVVLLEPTDGAVQLGCLGNVVARARFRATGGHSARPWAGTNAIAPAVHALGAVLAHAPREVDVGGLRFVETASPTRVAAGVADNVLPAEATVTVNFRYAPDRTPEEAEAVVRELLGRDAEVDVVGNAPAGRVVSDSSLVHELTEAGAGAVEPKLAWTNVADFTSAGIDAVNFGPGHTAQAHRPEEHVTIDALTHAYETLRRFLTGGMGEDPG